MSRELTATLREKKGRHAAQRLRDEGLIPAVLYRDGKVGTNLAIVRREWAKTVASGTRVVTLKLAGGDRQALIKDVQYDVLGESFLHVDFNELREGEKVRVQVAVVTKGTPKGHADGGVLNQPVHTLHIECLPTSIPEKIVIDVEPMKVDDVLHVKEMKLPEGVSVVDDANTVVVSVHVPRAEEPAAAPAEGAPTEPEVLTAKKEEEPAEGAAPAKAGEKKKEEKK